MHIARAKSGKREGAASMTISERKDILTMRFAVLPLPDDWNEKR